IPFLMQQLLGRSGLFPDEFKLPLIHFASRRERIQVASHLAGLPMLMKELSRDYNRSFKEGSGIVDSVFVSGL
ncbi:MAG: hypothetical protein VX761_08245, partial [Planctomycetota bacterium]|nr:hypothetical protein [Planctomycetota bacterium]